MFMDPGAAEAMNSENWISIAKQLRQKLDDKTKECELLRKDLDTLLEAVKQLKNQLDVITVMATDASAAKTYTEKLISIKIPTKKERRKHVKH